MRITMAHGSGGEMTGKLIEQVFSDKFSNPILERMEDSAVLSIPSAKIAFTTDSFVVDPIFFRGGDIGKLAVCGTVNDLLMQGAVPKYLSVGFILEEGLLISDLEKIAGSMADACREAGVIIVAGDTKVVEGNGGLYINTSGIGIMEGDIDISSKNAKDGDVIILSGELGDHHACILSARMGIENGIKSDCAPLCEMVHNITAKGEVHVMRDVTRGGLATVLNEIAKSSNVAIEIEENSLPIDGDVSSFCNLLGLDPLFMGNEGKMLAIVPAEAAEGALEAIRGSKYGSKAAVIGRVKADRMPVVRLLTRLGGTRNIGVLVGEGLPRIC